MPKQKKCAECEKKFTPFRLSTEKYCSYVCANKNRKPKAGRRKDLNIKKKPKKTTVTEMDIFLEIWSERPHVSELTEKPLLPQGHKQWHWQFLHVLNKGRFPSLRLDKNNILLGLPEEHENQDEYEVFKKRKQELLLEQYGRASELS